MKLQAIVEIELNSEEDFETVEQFKEFIGDCFRNHSFDSNIEVTMQVVKPV